MSRQARLLIVVLVAVVVGGVASFGVYYTITSTPPEQVEVTSVFVVVATKPLDVGVSLTKEDVALVAWPESNPVKDAYSKIEDVVNRGLIDGVVTNEPITIAKLAPAASGTGLSPAIKPGMRAVSVRVTDVIGVAGFVVPGTKVDVLVTVVRAGDSRTRVVLSNVQVLTAGTRYDEAVARQEGKPIPSSVVTLMVSPSDAERITLAQTEGQIMLALRNPLDTETTQTSGISAAALLQGPADAVVPAVVPAVARGPRRALAPPPPLPPPPPPPPQPWRVELITDGKLVEVTLP